jgi:hypothetical protein
MEYKRKGNAKINTIMHSLSDNLKGQDTQEQWGRGQKKKRRVFVEFL